MCVILAIYNFFKLAKKNFFVEEKPSRRKIYYKLNII